MKTTIDETIVKNKHFEKYDFTKLQPAQPIGQPRALPPEAERLVLKLLDEGFSAGSIADVFGISRSTVRKIRERNKENII